MKEDSSFFQHPSPALALQMERGRPLLRPLSLPKIGKIQYWFIQDT